VSLAGLAEDAGLGRAYNGTHPSGDGVRRICRKASEATQAWHGLLEPKQAVDRLNRACSVGRPAFN